MVRTGRPRKDPRDPAEIMRGAGLEPLEPYPGGRVPWRCRHTACGREVTPRLSNVTKGQGGCVHCSGRARIDPEAAAAVMRAAGLEPLEPYPGTAFPWKSRCTGCGAIVSPRLGSLTGKSRRPGCKPCADRATGAAQRHDEDLAVAEMREHGFEPQEPYRGVKYPWRCLCHGCGTVTAPTFGSILAGQSGCRRCADLRAAAARREDPERAAASMRGSGLEPLEPYTTSMTPWRCRCTTCGRTSTPTLARIRSGRGCKYCASHGFDRAAPARVYVVTHSEHDAVKIGVAGACRRNDRIAQHARYGWTLFYEHYVPTGDEALVVEQTILRRLRSAGHGIFLTAAQLPNGWTETFDAQCVSAVELRDAIRSKCQPVLPPVEPLTLF